MCSLRCQVSLENTCQEGRKVSGANVGVFSCGLPTDLASQRFQPYQFEILGALE